VLSDETGRFAIHRVNNGHCSLSPNLQGFFVPIRRFAVAVLFRKWIAEIKSNVGKSHCSRSLFVKRHKQWSISASWMYRQHPEDNRSLNMSHRPRLLLLCACSILLLSVDTYWLLPEARLSVACCYCAGQFISFLVITSRWEYAMILHI
jgi:hypothetical protein